MKDCPLCNTPSAMILNHEEAPLFSHSGKISHTFYTRLSYKCQRCGGDLCDQELVRQNLSSVERAAHVR